mgnify:CR=1 FL=1|jgi:glycosyltransferase involved in cell wall biosynthesis
MLQKLNIISPIFNEEKNIDNFFNGLKIEKDKLSRNYDINFIFVDDGSTDKSKQILKNLEKDNDFVKVVFFTKNFGHQNAVLAGLKEFESDMYLVLDADLQHDTTLIPQMLENMKKFNCEIVHMKRKYSNYEGVIKRLFSRIFYSIFNKLAEVQIPKGAPDFFLIKRCVRDEILKTKISYNFIRGFLHWSGFSKVLIEFDQIKRKSGKSKFTFIKQLEFALAGIYYYSNKLPVYFFVMSAVVLFFSFIYLLFILIGHFFFGNIDSEFPVTLVSILIFGSISILFNSVILFILFKIFSFSSQKPNYIKENKKEDE